jgi:hypothetical protein
VTTGIIPIRSRARTTWEDRSPSSLGRTSSRCATALYDVSSLITRGARTAQRPEARLPSLDNLDQTIAFANTWTLTSRTVNETRAQITHGDLEAPPTDPVGPAVSIAGGRQLRHAVEQPDGPGQHALRVLSTPVAPGGRARARAGVDVLYNDDTITFRGPFKGRTPSRR